MEANEKSGSVGNGEAVYRVHGHQDRPHRLVAADDHTVTLRPAGGGMEWTYAIGDVYRVDGLPVVSGRREEYPSLPAPRVPVACGECGVSPHELDCGTGIRQEQERTGIHAGCGARMALHCGQCDTCPVEGSACGCPCGDALGVVLPAWYVTTRTPGTPDETLGYASGAQMREALRIAGVPRSAVGTGATGYAVAGTEWVWYPASDASRA